MPFTSINIGSGRRSGSPDPGGGTPGDGAGITPYAGVADWDAPKNSATILGLQQLQRGPAADRTFPLFRTSAEGNDAGYYAYPKIYGLATFNETDENGNIIGIGDGGWDGANGDPITTFGPKEVIVVIDGISIPFYVYVMDWPGNGEQWWKVT